MRQNNLRFLHGTATVREKNGGNKAFYCVRKKEFTMAWIPSLLHAAHYTRGNMNEQDKRSVTRLKLRVIIKKTSAFNWDKSS